MTNRLSCAICTGPAIIVLFQALQFEHRDLHRGNVLVRRTDQEYIHFRLDGVEYSIKSYGAMATIVDYTFSRITQGDHYNNWEGRGRRMADQGLTFFSIYYRRD